jgi:hypothetical protein
MNAPMPKPPWRRALRPLQPYQRKAAVDHAKQILAGNMTSENVSPTDLWQMAQFILKDEHDVSDPRTALDFSKASGAST